MEATIQAGNLDLNILEYKECKEQAIKVRDATKANEVDEATWKKLEMKARTILISTASDKQLEKYKSMYSTKLTALQIICRGQLEDIKLKNYEKVQEKIMTVPNNEKRKNVYIQHQEKGTVLQLWPGRSFQERLLETTTDQLKHSRASQSRGRGQRGSERGYKRGSSRGRGRGRGAAQ